LPALKTQVVASHAPALVIERAQIVAILHFRIEECAQVWRPARVDGHEIPAEYPPRVVSMALCIAARGHVEDNPTPALLPPPGVGELQSQLRLADARSAHDDRQRARQQSTAEQLIEPRHAGG
jgi:hypothetical protein